MTTIQKERVEKKYYNVYVANDGTEFSDEAECKKYEESAYAVLHARYQKLVVNTTNEYDFFSWAGSEDTDVEIVMLSTQNDADVVKQIYVTINSHLLKGENKDRLESVFSTIDKALANNDVLLVGRPNYERDQNMWFFGTLTDVIEKMKSYVNV